jgi:hypothetical protein
MFHDKRGRAESSPAIPPVPNRRETERFGPADDQAWLGWWEGRIYRKSPATLINISQGGVKLIAVTAPPRRSTTWICLEGMHQTEWVEGQVLEVSRRPDGFADVRLGFCELCPYAFFEVAVYGFPDTPAPLPTASTWARSTR